MTTFVTFFIFLCATLNTIHLIQGQGQASTFQCPPKSNLSCSCEVRNGKTFIFCFGDSVSQQKIDTTLQDLRQVNNILHDDWLILQRFIVIDTNLTQLDLSSFLKLRLDELKIYENRKLVTITGPPLNVTGAGEGQIHVSNLIVQHNQLTTQGIGQILKYFSGDTMTHLELMWNQLTGPPSSPLTTNGVVEFLPGLSNLTQLTHLSLSGNEIQRLVGGQFRQNVRLLHLDLSWNPMEEIGHNAFSFLDPPPEFLNETLKIDLSNCELTAAAFASSDRTGLEKIRRPVHLILRSNEFTTLPSNPLKGWLEAFPVKNKFTIDLQSNPLVCDKKVEWLRGENATRDFSTVLLNANCDNDAGETVFTSTYVHTAFNQICPVKKQIQPCSCGFFKNVTSIRCVGKLVTQERIDNVLEQFRRVNNIDTDKWLSLGHFLLESTNLTHFSLHPFIKVRMDTFWIHSNEDLTLISGPHVHLTAGLIDVRQLSVTDSKLTMNGFGETLKYFSNNMTTLILTHNRLQKMPSDFEEEEDQLFQDFDDESLDVDGTNEFLPGLSRLRNLKHLSLQQNRIGYLGRGNFRRNNQLQTLDLGGNQIRTIPKYCFLFDAQDHDGAERRDRLTIILNSNLLNANSFPPQFGTEGLKRHVHLAMDNNPFLHTVPRVPFESFISQGNSMSLRRNELMCDKKMQLLRDQKADFFELIRPANCKIDVGKPVFTTENLITAAELPHICLKRERISPCDCQILSGRKTFSCSGSRVTPTSLKTFVQNLTEVHQMINSTPPLSLEIFQLHGTNLVELDLSIFANVRFQLLEISCNLNLTKIIGRQSSDVSQSGPKNLSIEVTELKIIFNPRLTRHGIGETLKYFSPDHLTYLNLQDNFLGSQPSADENSDLSDPTNVFLPGLSALKNLKEISLESNKILGMVPKIDFKKHTKLIYLLLGDNQLNQISDEVFVFDDSPNETANDILHLNLSRNHLTENSFEFDSNFGRVKRPVKLDLSFNPLTTFPQIPFEAFLDARHENFLDLRGTSLFCDDRVAWLRQRKADLKGRVVLPDCTNDKGQTIFESTLFLHDPQSDSSVIILSVLIPLLVVVIIAAIFLYYRYRRTKQQLRDLTEEEVNDFKNGNSTFDPHDPHAPIHSRPFDSSLEIPEHLIEIDKNKILGSGQFGVVYKGILITMADRMMVAVKTVKSNVDVETFKALLSEIKIMGHISRHQNIVFLHGACTTKIDKREALAVVEFCGNMDLRNYLKARRQFFQSQIQPADQPELQPYADYRDRVQETSTSLSTLNLLKFSLGVANGMRYLTTKNVIHGDLAARNILLTDDLEVKISDFGLSRQLIEYTNYIKKTQIPLPCKWMSPEAIKDLNFSIKSDVWSFGVVLYEIFSLGELPYPGLPVNREFIDQLLKGYRMSCPQHADQEVYDLMLKCWQTEPHDRPSFDFLRDQISLLTIQ